MKRYKQLYLTNTFFYSLLIMAALFVISFFVKQLFIPVALLFWVLIGTLIWDFIFLFNRNSTVAIKRQYPEKLSNGDDNSFALLVESNYPREINVRVLEEYPEALQVRDQEFQLRLQAFVEKEVHYILKLKRRGIYTFGKCYAMIQFLGFFERKITHHEELSIPCYPSFIQLRKYQLLATTNRLNELGVKRIRRIGAAMEFDHVRDYVQGDDYRRMNWKASAKVKKLMVNQFEEEKSQPIYSFIDTGRAMRMPFEEMTLLDYAINAALVLSNAAILKQDRAGMLTFSKEIGNQIIAEKRNNQMMKISEALYHIQTAFEESEFGNLYSYANKHINKRSLIFIYTNFETLDALNRQLAYLKMLNRTHILVVIVFKNTELDALAKSHPKRTIEIYNQIVAEKFIFEKSLIIQELNRNGIQTIYTEPQNLTINSINKYLEIKARGII